MDSLALQLKYEYINMMKFLIKKRFDYANITALFGDWSHDPFWMKVGQPRFVNTYWFETNMEYFDECYI
jgi:hypothetical protein